MDSFSDLCIALVRLMMRKNNNNELELVRVEEVGRIYQYIE